MYSIVDKAVNFFLNKIGNQKIVSEYHKRGNGNSIDYTRQALVMHAREIEDWQMAMMEATDPDNPRRGNLMRFYRNMMTDLHLGSCTDNRILPVQCAPYKMVDDADNEDTNAKRLLDKPWHLDMIRLVCSETFEGTKLIGMTDLNDNLELKSVYEVPQSNFLPHKGIVVKEEYDEQGISYRTGRYKDYYFQVGGDWNLGLFSQIAIIVLAKKLGLGSWMGYIDKFGVPPIFAVTDRYDSGRLKELFTMLQNFRQNHFAVLQGNEKIEVPNNYQVDVYNTFESLIKMADDQMSKRILGGTGAVDEKAYVGSAEVHERLLKYRHIVDKLIYKTVFNEEIKPRLVKISPVYAPLEKLRLEWDESETLTLKEFIEAVSDLSLHYEFDIEELVKITGLPITGLKKLLGMSTPAEPAPDEKKKPDANLNTGPVAVIEPPTASAWDETIDQIARLLHEGKLKPEDLNREMVLQTYGNLSTGAAQGWGGGFFEYNTPKGQVSIQQQLRDNLFWFSGAKTYQQLEEFNGMLLDNDGKVRPYHEFRKDVKLISDKYNEVYLETEHSATLANAHAARDWQGFEANKDVYPRLKFRTMEDADVRPEHALLNGVVRSVDDPKLVPPPLEWGCRCWLEQTTDPETAMPNITINPIFSNNPGKTGEAFTVMHPYFQMPKSQLARVKSQTELTKLYAPYQKVDDAQVWVNHFADERDLPANLQAAKTLAANHAAKVRIRPHIEPGKEAISNPEFYINGQTADLKKVSGTYRSFENGVKSAQKQGCSVVVFRIDHDSLDTAVLSNDISRLYSPNKQHQPKIEELYLIHGNRSVKVTKQDVLSGKHKALIEKLKG